MQHLIGEEKERTLVRAVLSLFLLVTKRLYGKEWEWSIGQIKTCRKKQHVEIDDRKEMPDLFCGKAAVGGNYNLMRDSQALATFEGFGADATVLAISGASLPYSKLDEIKQKIDDNKDTIKRNLMATSERRLTGSIDFLGDVTSEKPKTEKKKSTRDMLFM